MEFNYFSIFFFVKQNLIFLEKTFFILLKIWRDQKILIWFGWFQEEKISPGIFWKAYLTWEKSSFPQECFLNWEKIPNGYHTWNFQKLSLKNQFVPFLFRQVRPQSEVLKIFFYWRIREKTIQIFFWIEIRSLRFDLRLGNLALFWCFVWIFLFYNPFVWKLIFTRQNCLCPKRNFSLFKKIPNFKLFAKISLFWVRRL